MVGFTRRYRAFQKKIEIISLSPSNDSNFEHVETIQTSMFHDCFSFQV